MLFRLTFEVQKLTKKILNMALTISFACDTVSRELTVNIANPGGKYKLLGSGSLGVGAPNSFGGNDYNFTVYVQNEGSGHSDPITFTAGQLIPNSTVKCDDTSNNQLDVWVLEYADAGGDSVKFRKKKKATI